MEETRRTWTTESIKQGLHGLTEPEAANTGPAWVCTLCVMILAWCFVGLLTVRMGVSLTFCQLLELFSFCWVTLFNLNMRCFVLFYFVVSSLILFGYSLLKASSFLKGNREGMDLEKMGKKRKLGRMKGGKTMVWIYCMRKESIF